MDKRIEGLAYVLGDNIDTDQIIPAKHLIYDMKDPEERKLYARYALSGLLEANIPFVKEGQFSSEFQILIAGRNFGCGSSREHAPFALKEAGIRVVVAESYSRLFFRNSVDGAFYPPVQTKEFLNNKIKTYDRIVVDLSKNCLQNITQDQTYPLIPLGDVSEILEVGGIFEYAKKQKKLT